MRHTALFAVAAALQLSLPAPCLANVRTQLVAVNVPNLIGIEHAPADSRLFLIDQAGRILVYDGTTVLPAPFLDIRERVDFGVESGLLGLAFHPRYNENGRFYVNYIPSAEPRRTRLAAFRVSTDRNVADAASETIVLEHSQDGVNHNGGQLRFGPDGYLYLALGDSTVATNGQRMDTLLGKLLRIDVDSGSPYAIPPGNPFVGTAGVRPEIWASGLRNPWRFSFDRATGDLFLGDVGQNEWEEVNVQPAGAGGANYGWHRMEGRHCFSPPTGCNPGTPVLTLPAIEYPHALGCSVTAGFRYRGTLIPALVGAYVFADLCSGRIWAAAPVAGGAWRATELLHSTLLIPTLGEDVNGEIFMSNYAAPGHLYRLLPADPVPVLSVSVRGAGSGTITSAPEMLYCGFICGTAVTPGTAITLTGSPDAATWFSGWAGDLDCADGAVTMTSDRSCTAVFGGARFTDDVLSAGSTTVRALHVSELRARIDALRDAAGLPSFGWTTPTLTAGATVIQAVHIRELRTAIDDVYAARGHPAPPYTDGGLPAGTTIRAIHIAELRTAVLTLEP